MPLTVIRSITNRLDRELTDRLFADYFQKINDPADRFSAMIQFTKTYEDIGVYAPVWLDAGSLVDVAVRNVARGNVRIGQEISSGTEVFADPLIARVFYNLRDNAVRYGGTVTTVRFISKEQNGDRLIIGKDDGIGVPADEKEKIFDHGFRKNTRMGLFRTREILGIPGITIKKTGEPGTGARFEMTVPKGMWRTAGGGA